MPKTMNPEAPARTAGRPRDEAVRDRILNAALELLEQIGFAQVTCDAIAERCGASKATIYRWWPNKAAVLIDAFVRSVEPEHPLQDVRCLEEFVKVHMRQFTGVLAGRNGRLLAAVIAAAQDDPEVEAAFLSHWVEPRRRMSRQILERYQAEGQIPEDFDLELLLDAMYGPLVFRRLVRHGRLTPAYAENLAAMLLHGFLPR